jgi:hypothetical protein
LFPTAVTITSGSNANGYWSKDSSGKITQWGVIAHAGLTFTLTFPINFTVQNSISIMHGPGASQLDLAYNITSVSTCDIVAQYTGVYAYWQAIGY